jgi:hypothetical protein
MRAYTGPAWPFKVYAPRRAMTRKEVLVNAIEGRLTWITAADILNVTPRHIRRLRLLYEQSG